MSTNSCDAIVIPKTWDDAPGTGYVVHDPLTKLLDKYLHGGSRLSLEFDLYAARRSTELGWCDRIEGADLTATLLMNSKIESRHVDAVLANRIEIENALAEVPNVDLAIVDLDRSPLRAKLLRLFAAFRVPGVSIAKVTKLLCLKRPKLIPMIDSYVLAGLYDDPPSFDSDPTAFAEETLRAVGLFRRLLLWPTGQGSSNHEAIATVAAELTSAVRRESNVAIELSPIRVLDNLLWFEHEGFKAFGYTWDDELKRVVHPEHKMA